MGGHLLGLHRHLGPLGDARLERRGRLHREGASERASERAREEGREGEGEGGREEEGKEGERGAFSSRFGKSERAIERRPAIRAIKIKP